MIRVLSIFGTRPEAIKLCPLVDCLASQPTRFVPLVCVTAQHRTLLDQVLELFQVKPDYDLDIMTPGQTLTQSTSRILAGLEPVLESAKPDMVIVQGDTNTTLAGALAAFYQRIPVGHVEAGLRTGDPTQPFPEEINRILTGRIANLHFAATERAADNLLREGLDPSTISVTGNTGIDAVLGVAERLERGLLHTEYANWAKGRRLIVVTAHRRENFGDGINRICEALRILATQSDIQIVFSVHPNPRIRNTVSKKLSGITNIELIDPPPYPAFVDLMRQAYLLITDSGGIQEEGPSLGKPVIVLRNTTERPEAVDAGTVLLAGTDPGRIVALATQLLTDTELYQSMKRVHNPYGDGRACPRIANRIRSFFNSY